MSYFLRKKLNKWQVAGLIDQSTRNRIDDFENDYKSSYALNAVMGLGAIAIMVGIISVIAANWYLIPGQIKLICNFTWLCCLGWSINYFRRTERKNEFEIAVFLMYGSILGAIALIGQVYHLESHPFKANLLWLVLGTPILLYSTNIGSAFVWGISLIALESNFISFINPNNWADRFHYFGFLPLFLFYTSIVFQNFSNKENFRTATFQLGSFIYVVFVLAIGSSRWHNQFSVGNIIFPLSILLLSIPMTVYIFKKYRPVLALAFQAGVLFLEVPNMFLHGDLKIVGGILFIIVCSLFAYSGMQMKNKKMFDYSCLFIALRIIVIYFEVFGSLLQTGIGLIISGAIVLGVSFLWLKKKDLIWKMGGKIE